MRTPILSIFLFLAIFSSGSRQTDRRVAFDSKGGATDGPLVREVQEIKRQYDVAQMANDGAWFERMLAADYVFILADGSVTTKADFVRDMRTKDLVWKSASVKDIKIRVYGDSAVVTGRVFGKGQYEGISLDERQRFTSLWIKRSGRWQGISEHGSKLSPPDDQ